MRSVFFFRGLLAGMALVFLFACSPVKHLAEGELLYHATEVAFADGNRKEKAKMTASLAEIARPVPNSKTLGLFRLRLGLYYLAGEAGKEKGLRNFIRKKLGEAPALYTPEAVRLSALKMEKELQDRGYLGATVKTELTIKDQRATVMYAVQSRGRYVIDSLHYPPLKDPLHRLLFSDRNASLLQQGRPYDGADIAAERERLFALAGQQGYFDFEKSALLFYVDTAQGNKSVDLYLRVLPAADSLAYRPYLLRDIYVYPDYSITGPGDQALGDTLRYEELNLIQAGRAIKPKALRSLISLQPDLLFDTQLHARTVSKLLDFGMYKFVNLRYQRVGDHLLDGHIYLTPALRQDVTAEVQGTSRTGNFIGSSVSFSYQNRNTFWGGELLNAALSAGVETQITNKNTFINTLDITGSLDLSLPRLLIPFRNNVNRSGFIPRSRIGISNNYQRRVEYFSINTFTTQLGLDWRRQRLIRHRWEPVTVSLVRLLSTTEIFDQVISRNPQLRSSYEDVSIIGSTYAFTYSEPAAIRGKTYYYLKASADVSGNTAYLVAKVLNKQNPQPYSFLGVPFSQYGKAEIDARAYRSLNRQSSLALRLYAGAGVPYGNAQVLPYVKQFFGGGSSGLRAFRIRTLGPGTYVNEDLPVTSDFIDQTGDIKLETNAELRFDLISYLKGAVFVDAGNIWLMRADSLRPGGVFRWRDFPQQIAVGTGLGLRLDFSYFVIRTDFAFPLRKPWLPPGDRWTFSEINPLKRSWREENLVLNLAIGYPF